MNASEFKSAVKRLNYNVMSLCLRTDTDVSTVHPLHTFRNIIAAVDAYLANKDKR